MYLRIFVTNKSDAVFKQFTFNFNQSKFTLIRKSYMSSLLQKEEKGRKLKVEENRNGLG